MPRTLLLQTSVSNVPEKNILTNTVLELARSRKTVRKFKAKPPSMSDVLRALEAGRQAPSGANRQPWHFIIVTEPEAKRRLRESCEKGERELYKNVRGEFKEWLLSHGLSPDKPFLEEAPLLVAVLMEAAAQYARESVWVSVGYILLALEEMGLSTITYTPSNTDLPLGELNAPEGFKLETILPIGYSADDKPKEPKHSLEEVAFLNSWGNPVKPNRKKGNRET
jgi:nitroreductase